MKHGHVILGIFVSLLLVACSSPSNDKDIVNTEQDLKTPFSCSTNAECVTDNACQKGTCSVSSICEYVPLSGASCDDENACTEDDSCSDDGYCLGASNVVCDDSNPCTTDICDPVDGCSYDLMENGAVCDDGSGCSTGDRCVDGVCMAETIVACPDPDPNDCTYAACDPKTGQCDSNESHPEGHPCLDGNPCTQSDECDGSGQCISGAPYECTAQHPCKKSWCNEQAKEDTNPCILEWKQEGVGCNDGDACTDNDECTTTGDDEDLECTGAAIDCNDSNSCTGDACEEETGCVYTDKSDGTPCGDGPPWSCLDGECNCDPDCDGQECGDDGCGDLCGSCDEDFNCNDQGVCVEGPCEPQCDGKDCGPDGCNDVCGTCQGQAECSNGTCVCQGDCTDLDCGDDGCGGSCGNCQGQDQCMNGTCICQPDCGGKDCGDDGCGWNCGSCNGNFICTNGKCTCPPGDCGPEINWVEGEPYPVADNKIAPSVIAVDGTDIHLFGGTKWARHVVFNATSGTWTIKELLPFHISDGAAGTVNGVIYACGDGSFGAVEMYRYEEGADTWTKLAGNPYPRRLPGYAVVDGKIYLAGGFAGSYNMKTNVYNPSNDSWSALADIKPPNGTGVLYGAAFNSKFYIFGGNDDQSDVYMFTPGNNSWTQQQSIPKDRYMGMAVTVGDEILLLGGRQSNTAKDSVYVFDPAANNWSESEPLPAAVYGGQAAYVNGKIYIFSGSNGIGNYSDKTWIGTVQ